MEGEAAHDQLGYASSPTKKSGQVVVAAGLLIVDVHCLNCDLYDGCDGHDIMLRVIFHVYHFYHKYHSSDNPSSIV